MEPDRRKHTEGHIASEARALFPLTAPAGTVPAPREQIKQKPHQALSFRDKETEVQGSEGSVWTPQSGCKEPDWNQTGWLGLGTTCGEGEGSLSLWPFCPYRQQEFLGACSYEPPPPLPRESSDFPGTTQPHLEWECIPDPWQRKAAQVETEFGGAGPRATPHSAERTIQGHRSSWENGSAEREWMVGRDASGGCKRVSPIWLRARSVLVQDRC